MTCFINYQRLTPHQAVILDLPTEAAEKCLTRWRLRIFVDSSHVLFLYLLSLKLLTYTDLHLFCSYFVDLNLL